MHLSLPLVGVWIEIYGGPASDAVCSGHSPWWECGLKFSAMLVQLEDLKSLPLVGVWIEIQD